MEQPHEREQGRDMAYSCHWHPWVETGLYCSQCGKHICTQCMVQATVGIRCRDCGKVVLTPTYDVSLSYYVRATAAAGSCGIAGGLVWAFITYIFGGIPFFPSMAAIGIGYGIGEVISLSVNRKRGAGLAWIAAFSTVVAFLISWTINPFGFGMFSFLFLGVGVYSAVLRVR